MTEPKRPKPPTGLSAAGKRLWTTIVADVAPEMELDARDLDVLGEACAMQDTIASLEKAIKRDGEVLDGARGPRTHPAVIELRQARVAKMRLLCAVDLSDRVMTPASLRAKKAAEVRWDLERKKWGRRGAA
jgi:phage terminase small subunit